MINRNLMIGKKYIFQVNDDWEEKASFLCTGTYIGEVYDPELSNTFYIFETYNSIHPIGLPTNNVADDPVLTIIYDHICHYYNKNIPLYSKFFVRHDKDVIEEYTLKLKHLTILPTLYS